MKVISTRQLAAAPIPSLIGNLILAGFVAGSVWRAAHRGPMPPSPFPWAACPQNAGRN